MHKYPSKSKTMPREISSPLGKSLPASLEAERSVLGALLLNDEALSRVAEIIRPEDFYVGTHALIYQAMLELSAQHQRVDLVSLQDMLIKKAQLESVGGIVYLISLQEEIPALGFVEQHARIINAETKGIRDQESFP